MEHREIDGVVHAFLEALDRDEEPPCNAADNLRSLAPAFAALESCRTDQRVDVEAMIRQADAITRTRETET